MSNVMPKEKATKIMQDFAKNKFHKAKTLIDNGYAEETATSRAGKIINKASEVVKQNLGLDKEMNARQVSETVLDIVGMSRDEVIDLYKFVLVQERDLPSKLKALAPLLRSVGVHLEENMSQTVIPVLNIGITERNDGLVEPHPAIVSENVDCATLENGSIEGVAMEGEGRQDELPV